MPIAVELTFSCVLLVLQLPFGRRCINNYKQVKRQCVFSHEELVCKMAADPDSMDFQLAAQTHQELLAIVENERVLRQKLLSLVSSLERRTGWGG